MKMNITLTALVLSMAAAPLAAHESGPRFGVGQGESLSRADRAEIAAERFEAADADGDGFLTAEELAAAAEAARGQRREDRVARMLEARDANADGALSLEEMQAPRREAMFDRLDADGDGAISVEEFEAMEPPHGRAGRRAHR